ncbi:MAG TPA: AMP-binding protein, partial [Pseudonocardiaceae bacterium]|nr:AMP-binding protein [Pseudonocardiaceae bacterium]
MRFLHGEREVAEWTYAELVEQARRVAHALAGRYRPGDRVLLLLPSGPDLAIALFGCLGAGLAAVPAALPASGRLQRYRERVASVLADSAAAVALTLEAAEIPDGLLPEGVDGLALDALPAPPRTPLPDVDPDAVAYLQYSSGSTGSPKGVRNTHRSLLHHVERLGATVPAPDPVQVVGWLPLYHDMGMIQQLLLPLLAGGTSTFMAPKSFAADPGRWLRAAAQYRATWIAGPDFAYQRSCDAIPPSEVAALDLSALRCVSNGAEPVRPATLERFAEHFAAAGLRREAITPCYGLAEAGLCVSTSRRPAGWLVNRYDAAALAGGSARPSVTGRPLVACGDWFLDWDVRIVDPRARQPLPDGQVGEIWVAGEGLPDGYWGRPEETEHTFRARIAGGTGNWLRTGDLGFFDDGRLFVCGRLKDLIIIRGANHHPGDIERTVEQSVAEVAIGGACAVQLDGDGRLMVAVEVDRDTPPARLAELATEVRQAVYAGHEIVADDVVLVRRSGLPKTTSGKIRRRATAAAFDGGGLPVLHTDRLGLDARRAPSPAGDTPALLPLLCGSLAELLGREDVAVDLGFAELGLDSLTATRWVHQVSQRLGRAVPVTVLYRHPNLRELAAALSMTAAPPTPARPAGTASAVPGRMEPVAIIGVGLCLPGGIRSLDALAGLLMAGRSAVGEPPAGRALDGVPLTLPGAYLAAVDEFDAELFGIGGAEAQAMDPQQRLLLEVAWHALEDAGLPASSAAVRGARLGVFVGQGHHDYSSLPLRLGHPEWVRAFHATGASMSSAAGRIAHRFGLRGPAMVIDTACSASLVAIDTACRHLADR